MKKNIIIGLLATTTLLSTIFSIYQRTLTEEHRKRAIENEIMARNAEQAAMEQKMLAERMAEIAAKNQQEAEMQRALAVTALDECEKKLKGRK